MLLRESEICSFLFQDGVPLYTQDHGLSVNWWASDLLLGLTLICDMWCALFLACTQNCVALADKRVTPYPFLLSQVPP